MLCKRDKLLCKNGGYSFVEATFFVVVVCLIVMVIVSSKEIARAAKVRAVMTQVFNFKSSVNGFKMKYHVYPGDMKNATAYWPGQTINGDGDGKINYVVGVNEDLRGWQQLALAGMIPGKFTGMLDTGNILTANKNIPPSKIEKTGYRIVYPTYKVYGKYGNAFILGLAGYRFISGAMFTSQEAWTIDSKMDDGEADGGMIYTINGWTNYYDFSSQGTSCVTGAVSDNSSDYTFYTLETCTIHFWID